MRKSRSSKSRFLPTPSARRATTFPMDAYAAEMISTHALREEGDVDGYSRSAQIFHFYPRPPRGGRQQTCRKIKAIFWQHLYNEIQLTKKAGCICAGCTIFEAQPACLSKTDRCEAAGDFLFAVPSHQSSALLTVYHKWVC